MPPLPGLSSGALVSLQVPFLLESGSGSHGAEQEHPKRWSLPLQGHSLGAVLPRTEQISSLLDDSSWDFYFCWCLDRLHW